MMQIMRIQFYFNIVYLIFRTKYITINFKFLDIGCIFSIKFYFGFYYNFRILFVGSISNLIC